MVMQKEFHLRVRAVVRDGEKVLVWKTKGKDYCALPGGHYGNGETLAGALKRELKEELGIDADIKQYLGVAEQGWQDGDVYNYEINHIFEVAASGLNADANPPASEDNLDFFWIGPEDFEKYDFRPRIIWRPLEEWLNGNDKIWYVS